MLLKEYYEFQEGPDSLFKRFVISFNAEKRTYTKRKKLLDITKPTLKG